MLPSVFSMNTHIDIKHKDKVLDLLSLMFAFNANNAHYNFLSK